VAATVKLNTPATGSAPTKDFKASTSLPVAKLAAAAKQAKKASMKYQISQGSKTWSTIFTNWANFKSMSTRLLITYKISLMSTHSLVQGSAYMWTADMDIDCNGIDFWHKVGTPLTAIIPSSNLDPWDYNGDSQAQTNLGALAAYEVPWIVIPGSFISKHSKDLPGNNVAAVIWYADSFNAFNLCSVLLIVGFDFDSDATVTVTCSMEYLVTPMVTRQKSLVRLHGAWQLHASPMARSVAPTGMPQQMSLVCFVHLVK